MDRGLRGLERGFCGKEPARRAGRLGVASLNTFSRLWGASSPWWSGVLPGVPRARDCTLSV